MYKFKKIFACISIAIMLITNTLLSYAAESKDNFDATSMESLSESNIFTNIEADLSKESINIPNYLKLREQGSLGINPVCVVSNNLSAENNQDFLLFSLSSETFMLARLEASNANYEAVLCFADYTTGILTPTNISKPANELIVFNGVPKGDYAIWIHSIDNSYGSNYNFNFNFNASNPSGNYKQIISLSNNLQYFGIEFSDGRIYANGKYVFDSSIIGTNTGNRFNWERIHDFQTGADYAYLKMAVSGVVPMKIEGPTFYHSAYASSDNVMLIYCDEGTTWVYTESKPFTMVDVFGRKTPRQLDNDDVYTFKYHDRYHILAYDINSGTVIDFFSPLNAYYFTGAESSPVNGITNGGRPAP